jgi:hypothetical protein
MLSKINTMIKKDFTFNDDEKFKDRPKIPTLNSSLKGVIVDKIKKSPIRKIVDDPAEVEFEFEDRLKKSVQKNLNKININYSKNKAAPITSNIFKDFSFKSLFRFYPFCYLVLLLLVIRLFFYGSGCFSLFRQTKGIKSSGW